jgi:hypothetical protein
LIADRYAGEALRRHSSDLYFQELLFEFQKITEAEVAAAQAQRKLRIRLKSGSFAYALLWKNQAIG